MRSLRDRGFTFTIEIDGQVYPIIRDVFSTHPQLIHDALGTHSEAELQQLLDRYTLEDFFDENFNYKGRDSNAIGLSFIAN